MRRAHAPRSYSPAVRIGRGRRFQKVSLGPVAPAVDDHGSRFEHPLPRSSHAVAEVGYATHITTRPTFPGERMKTSYAAILALALPVSLSAQQPSPSGTPPANPITAAFRGRTM